MRMSKLYKNKEKENEKPSNEPPIKQDSLKRMSSKFLGNSLNSFDLSGKLEQVDEYLKKYPFIIEFGYKLGIKPSYIVVFGGSALFISLVLGWGAALICNLVGFAYPGSEKKKMHIYLYCACFCNMAGWGVMGNVMKNVFPCVFHSIFVNYLKDIRIHVYELVIIYIFFFFKQHINHLKRWNHKGMLKQNYGLHTG